MLQHRSILLFVKSPEKGKTKSRLAAAIGEEAALDIYKCLVVDAVESLRKGDYPFRIFFYPLDSGSAVMGLLGEDFVYTPQTGEDLGKRMENAFSVSFSEGLERILLIGSDIPCLTEAIFDEAFSSLDHSDAVIGPVSDGGYYLIGFKKSTFLPAVFHGIAWSTDSVFNEAMKVFRETGHRVHILPELMDIDTFDDIQSLFIRGRKGEVKESRIMSYIFSNEDKLCTEFSKSGDAP